MGNVVALPVERAPHQPLIDWTSEPADGRERAIREHILSKELNNSSSMLRLRLTTAVWGAIENLASDAQAYYARCTVKVDEEQLEDERAEIAAAERELSGESKFSKTAGSTKWTSGVEAIAEMSSRQCGKWYAALSDAIGNLSCAHPISRATSQIMWELYKRAPQKRPSERRRKRSA